MGQEVKPQDGLQAASKAVNSCFLLIVWLMVIGLGLFCLWSVVAK